MHSVNALELPEVAHIIASYLSNLEPCLAVCRAWRYLYAPYFWREAKTGIKMAGEKSIPYFDPVCQSHYREFVQVLTVHSYLGFIDQSLGYPNLRMLRLCNHGEKLRSRFDDEENPVVKDFVSQHPLLECLDLDNIPPFIMESAWTALRDHPRLDRLIVSRISSIPDDFWRVCTRLSTLELRRLNLSTQCHIPEGLVLPSIRRVEVETSYSQDFVDELDIIAACPMLEELVWREQGFNRHPSLARFGQLATQGTWPHLQQLSMASWARDSELSQIIASMHQATKIEVTVQSFGPLSFAALQRHTSTLQHLSIPPALDSRVLRDVLCTFPRLECLKAPRIDAKDIAEGGSWVCTSLRKMSVEISFGSDEDYLQPVVFERMSRLVNLEEFDNGICHVLGLQPKHGLLFRLQSGMGALTGLSRLRVIGMDSHIQTMDFDDAQWIMDHWKRLETIRGQLSQDRSMAEQLKVLFSTSGIVTI